MDASTLRLLPALNATLNGTAALFLLIGHRMIRRGRMAAHRAMMLAAFATSAIFLCCYLYYHAHAGITRFAHAGWRRAVYLSILGSHTVLAVVIVPLILVTLYRGLKSDFGNHIKTAPITYWLWLYVSVTGVVIYLLLYQVWR